VSAHAVIDGVGEVAAVAIVPAIAAPATNAITGLRFFIRPYCLRMLRISCYGF
jgi:hypothetical protein